MNKYSKTWNRIKLPISRFKGTISRKYDINVLKKKMPIIELERILCTIEKKTNCFRGLKNCTKVIIIFISLIMFFLCLMIISLCHFKKPELALLFALSAFVFGLGVICIVFSIRKKLVKSIYGVVHEYCAAINQSVFIKRRLYIMPSFDLRYISIFIVPLSINLGVLVHNTTLGIGMNVNTNTEIMERIPDIHDVIRLNRRQSNFNLKYTNFKFNNITNAQF